MTMKTSYDVPDEDYDDVQGALAGVWRMRACVFCGERERRVVPVCRWCRRAGMWSVIVVELLRILGTLLAKWL